MRGKTIKHLDIPRTETYLKIPFNSLMSLSRDRTRGRSVNLSRKQYILLEAFYNGGIDHGREVLIRGAEQHFKLHSDSGCMLLKPRTRDLAWRIRDPKLAHSLGLVLGLIRGVRIKVRLVSPIKGKSKS